MKIVHALVVVVVLAVAAIVVAVAAEAVAAMAVAVVAVTTISRNVGNNNYMISVGSRFERIGFFICFIWGNGSRVLDSPILLKIDSVKIVQFILVKSIARSAT